MAEWRYKVVALPRDVAVMKKVFGGPDPKDVVAGYLERIIEAEAQQGWEFYRIDTVNILEQPGCLGSLLGQKETLTAYNLVTFRKPRGA
jgi:hypothetical protein